MPSLLSIDVKNLDHSILKTLDFEKYPPEIVIAKTLTFEPSNSGKIITEVGNLIVNNGCNIFADTRPTLFSWKILGLTLMIKRLRTYLFAVGINPGKTLKSLLAIPWYRQQKKLFLRLQRPMANWPVKIYPILLDREEQSACLGEYFWQDILVAKEIIFSNPRRHVDVGSRVDGFIAHLACVRKVEIFDIRPLEKSIHNVSFTQWDITCPNPGYIGVADCVSCLHTIEHIGLGRYGDQLDPDGWNKGLKSLVDLISPRGGLWLSVPIGIQRVEFNAHRIFDPATIIHASGSLGMKLVRFFYLTELGFIESINVARDVKILGAKSYALGVFYFTKDSNEIT